MVEDPNVKGNRISCRFYQGEAKDDASEICGALGGPAAREQFLKSIDEAAATACRSDQDESTCQSYKLDCIHTLSQGEHEDPITPDEVERCVEDRIRKNRAPSTAR
ncbi:hypothetical protein VCV18_012108 [Metarhizium anisopliae]